MMMKKDVNRWQAPIFPPASGDFRRSIVELIELLSSLTPEIFKSIFHMIIHARRSSRIVCQFSSILQFLKETIAPRRSIIAISLKLHNNIILVSH